MESGDDVLIEVIACSIHDAVAARRGGAGRLELVRALDMGGLTPDFDFVEEVVREVTIPVRVMIRDTADYAAGDPSALERLARAAARAEALGVDGIVLGFLRDGRIDPVAMNAVLQAAPATNVTFHHAFDELPDPPAAIERLHVWPQVDRVLTSAGPGTWKQKASRIAAWSRAASPIELLAGGGVDVPAIRALAASGAREAHVGRAARVPPTTVGAVSAERVAALIEAAGQ